MRDEDLLFPAGYPSASLRIQERGEQTLVLVFKSLFCSKLSEQRCVPYSNTCFKASFF